MPTDLTLVGSISVPGLGCSTMSPNNTVNYLEFIKELRGLTFNLILVSIGRTQPFLDTTGKPMLDVSNFAKVLDWIEIEVDSFIPSYNSITGPNAPLNDSCSPLQSGFVVYAVASCTKAGFPANQIVLAVLTIGFIYLVPCSIAVSSNNQLQVYVPFNCYDQFSSPVGRRNRDGSEVGGILTTAHQGFGGCAHRCAGKPKHREQDRVSLRRRGCIRSGTAEV